MLLPTASGCEDDRLYFTRLTGSGPDRGWVSIRTLEPNVSFADSTHVAYLGRAAPAEIDKWSVKKLAPPKHSVLPTFCEMDIHSTFDCIFQRLSSSRSAPWSRTPCACGRGGGAGGRALGAIKFWGMVYETKESF